MSSPYPWHYTLRWPYYYRWPSIKNHSNLPTTPITHNFISSNQAESKRILFCGDIMITQKDIVPTLHPDFCKLLNSADLLIGNCETPVGKQQLNAKAKYWMRFNMPVDFLTGIMNQLTLPKNQWVLSVANNHSGDQGEKYFYDTCHILTELGVTPVGCYHKNAMPITIIERFGLRIGIAAWTQWMNCEVFSDGVGAHRIHHILDANIRDIKLNHKLDFLIGLPHWEYEFQHYPRNETRQLAKTLIDEHGFNILIGAHPHTLMPMEWFQHGVCQYSLGNFCGLGSAWPVKLIPILEIKLGINNSDKGKMLGYALHPFVQLPQKDKIEIMPLEQAPQSLGNKIRKRLELLVKI